MSRVKVKTKPLAGLWENFRNYVTISPPLRVHMRRLSEKALYIFLGLMGVL
jgi:hypothetical protein